MYQVLGVEEMDEEFRYRASRAGLAQLSLGRGLSQTASGVVARANVPNEKPLLPHRGDVADGSSADFSSH